MAVLHRLTTSTLGGMHNPFGHSDQGPMTLAANNVSAYEIEDDLNVTVFLFDTTTGFESLQIGDEVAIPNIQFNISASNPNAFKLTNSTSDYELFDTLNDVLTFGDAVNNMAVRMGGEAALRLGVMDNTARDLLSASIGDLIFSTTDTEFQGYDGAWGSLGGGGIPHSVAGDENVIIENSGTSRAWLTAHITDDAIEIGNDGDFDGPRLQFGGFTALYIGRAPAGVVPSSATMTVVGNNANIAATTQSVGVGNGVRIDAGQAVAVGAGARASTNDTALGWNAVLTGSQSAHVGFGCVGNSAGFNSGIGGNLNYNAADNVILLGHTCAAEVSASNRMYIGGNATRRIDVLMVGTGGTDDTDADVKTTLTTSPKGTDTDSSNGWIISGGGSTGLGGSTVEIHGAITNFATGTTQHATQRIAHFEAVGLVGNPIEFGLHIGNETAIVAADAYLYFNAGDITNAVQASFKLDGLTDDMQLVLPSGGNLIFGTGAVAITDFYFGQGIEHTSLPTVVGLHATSIAAGTSNIAGGPLELSSGAGTGDADGSTLTLQVPHKIGTGSTQQTLMDYIVLRSPELDTTGPSGGYVSINTDRTNTADGGVHTGTFKVNGGLAGFSSAIDIPYATQSDVAVYLHCRITAFDPVAVEMASSQFDWSGRNAAGTLVETGDAETVLVDEIGVSVSAIAGGTGGTEFISLRLANDATNDTDWTVHWWIIETGL